MYFLTREDDAYSTYPQRFYLPYNPSYHAYQPAEFPQQYYGMRSSPVQMMAQQFAPASPLRSDSPASSTSEELSSTAPKKKNSPWTETEEKILIELFGDNEEKLRYNSPEWESIATQLHERCRREHVSSDKTAQQCKTKMSNLTKKYKTTKDNSVPLVMEKGEMEKGEMEKGEMKRLTRKQKAELSLCLRLKQQQQMSLQCCHFWKEPKRGMRRSWSEWQKPRGKAEEKKNPQSF